MEENISAGQAFRVLESLLFARKELQEKSGVSFGELDALIADKAEIFVRAFNKALNEKSDKKSVEKKSEMTCNCRDSENTDCSCV